MGVLGRRAEFPRYSATTRRREIAGGGSSQPSGRRRTFSGVLCDLFWAVMDFDAGFAEWVGQPVPFPPDAVVVSGSGKEPFKTFNVSTTAGILTAAAGAPVVKGVSDDERRDPGT